MTLTKIEDLLLSLTERSTADRPCVVLDPFGLCARHRSRADPEQLIAGRVDPKTAERRAKAFTAGTVKGALINGTGDEALPGSTPPSPPRCSRATPTLPR